MVLLKLLLLSALLRPAGATEGDVVLVAVGDIRLDGPVAEVAGREGPEAPAGQVAEFLAGDIVFGNLECALTKRGKARDKTYTFRAPPENLSILKKSGFTLVSLANNHVMDYGETGLKDTLAALDAAGIARVGAGLNAREAYRPVILEKKGLKIAFAAVTSTLPDENWAKNSRPGVAYSDPDTLLERLRRIKRDCDFLIVSYHGGTELMQTPNGVQERLVGLALEAGADVVLGHHPHVIQPVVVSGGKLAFYSLGNFLFVSPTPGTQWTAVARITLSKKGLKAELVPVEIGRGRLRPAGPYGRELIRLALDGRGALGAHPRILSLGGPLSGTSPAK